MPQLSNSPEMGEKVVSSSPNQDISAYYATISEVRKRAFREDQKPKEWQGVGDKLENLSHTVGQVMLNIKAKVAQIGSNDFDIDARGEDIATLAFVEQIKTNGKIAIEKAMKGMNSDFMMAENKNQLMPIDGEEYTTKVFFGGKKILAMGYFNNTSNKRIYGHLEFDAK